MGQNVECQNVEWDKTTNAKMLNGTKRRMLKCRMGQKVECQNVEKCQMGQNVECQNGHLPMSTSTSMCPCPCPCPLVPPCRKCPVLFHFNKFLKCFKSKTTKPILLDSLYIQLQANAKSRPSQYCLIYYR
jgi:hypothetical protein